MRTLKFILKKEFIQIFRNKAMLPIIFLVPIVQLLILVHAATFEIKNIEMVVVDKDLSTASRKLVSKFESSPFYIIKKSDLSFEKAKKSIDANQADIVLHVNKGFEQNLVRNNQADIQILINAINGQKAGLIQAYTNSIIVDFNNNIRFDWGYVPQKMQEAPQIAITSAFWYNPELNYKTFMVPGILVLLVTVIGMFLSCMNLVREKEIGTIEQINVTPIRKFQFIFGKLFPIWIIAMFELAFGLFLGKVIFHIPIVGSLGLVFGVAAVYLLVVLGIGLFISTLSDTQQQAMFIAWFFMIVFILMSGLFTSVNSMPEWAQWLNKINPVAYFIKVVRMIMLKGAQFRDIFTELLSLLIYGIIILSLAVWRYRKVV